MEAYRNRCTSSKLLQCDFESVSADDRRMDPVRDLTQLLERVRDLASRHAEARAHVRVRIDLLFQQTQLERERDQSLLRAVVEVALQSLPLLLTGVEHSRARSLQLFESRSQLDMQSAVFERDSGRRSDGVQQLRLVEERRIV